MCELIIMGNSCHKLATAGSTKLSMESPRNLEELLKEIKINCDTQYEDLDSAIVKSIWGTKFLDFLRKRNNSQEEISLFKFLILTEIFTQIHRAHHELRSQNNNSGNTSKRLNELFVKRELLMKTMLNRHFNEENDEEMISLSNQTLFNKLNGLVSSAHFQDNDYDLIEKARTDSSVWDEGLQPIYVRFIKQTNPSALACLLSIL